jgi:putative sterol carrier protein
MAKSGSMDNALQLMVKRIREHPAPLASQQIRLTLHGDGGGTWTLRTGAEGVSLAAGEGDGQHTVEVIAQAEAIRPVLEGKMDGRAAFLAGGIRVRGDVMAVEGLSAAIGTHQPHSAAGG